MPHLAHNCRSKCRCRWCKLQKCHPSNHRCMCQNTTGRWRLRRRGTRRWRQGRVQSKKLWQDGGKGAADMADDSAGCGPHGQSGASLETLHKACWWWFCCCYHSRVLSTTAMTARRKGQGLDCCPGEWRSPSKVSSLWYSVALMFSNKKHHRTLQCEDCGWVHLRPAYLARSCRTRCRRC